MSVMVAYPAEVKGYRVSVQREMAEIELEGIESPEEGVAATDAIVRRVGRMAFGDPNPIGDKDFITRGGFLRMDRPLTMFAGVLDLLRNEKPVFLHEDGTLSTSLEPTGEAEKA
jgi:hypothetical protein